MRGRSTSHQHGTLSAGGITPLRIAAASATVKIIGMAIAWALEHPRCEGARRFVASRASLRPLLEYSNDWATHIVAEGAIVVAEALALTAVSAFAPPRAARRILFATAVLDSALLLRHFPAVVRKAVSPLRTSLTSSRGNTHLLAFVTPATAATVGLVHGARTAIRTAVSVMVRHQARDEMYLKPIGVAAQAVGQGLVAGASVAVAGAFTALALHRRAAATTGGGGARRCMPRRRHRSTHCGCGRPCSARRTAPCPSWASASSSQ